VTLPGATNPRGEPIGVGSGGVVPGNLSALIACEYSGAVRDAFSALGWYAVSCDLLPTDSPGPHFHGDVRDIIAQKWDIMIAFPPCTYLCSSGMHWTTRGFRDPRLTEDALDFVRFLMDSPIRRIAIENPIGVISSRIRKPDQIIQPWQFGHGETKATCLWLKNLPPLIPTNIVPGRDHRVWRAAPGKDRWKIRSKTYLGVAAAMARQWTSFIQSQ
jgi:hypothetical protein